jgi:hypothetical protein
LVWAVVMWLIYLEFDQVRLNQGLPNILLANDLYRKPVPTFRDHAHTRHLAPFEVDVGNYLTPRRAT